MRTNRDRNFDAIKDALSMQISGREPRLFSSRKTLFGIPSALDEELANLDSDSLVPEKPGHDMDVMQSRRGGVHRVVHPLEPIFDENSSVLMLGTMPSPKSREVGMYYGHPQNRFWKVLAALFDQPFPDTNTLKREMALIHGIALWDVLAECNIEGAQDGTIADCIPNDISTITKCAPIKAVFCTGSKSYELYKKYSESKTKLPATKLPSTSSANAATSLDKLIDAYRVILPFSH